MFFYISLIFLHTVQSTSVFQGTWNVLRASINAMYGGDLLLTPCKRELPLYPALIAAEFQQNVVVPTGPNRNIRCVCDPRYIDYMNCNIYVRRDSLEASVIDKRLNRRYPDDFQRLRPFFVSPFHFRQEDNFVSPLFSRPGCAMRVFAGIYVIDDEKAKILRTLSAPSKLGRFIKTIPLHVCTDGSEDIVCPVLRTTFQDRDVVFILKRDAAKVDRGDVMVPCISSQGLRSMASVRADGKFLDPWKREGDYLLTIHGDYDAYVLIAHTEPCEHPEVAGPSISAQNELPGSEYIPEWQYATESLSDEDKSMLALSSKESSPDAMIILLSVMLLWIVYCRYSECSANIATSSAKYELDPI